MAEVVFLVAKQEVIKLFRPASPRRSSRPRQSRKASGQSQAQHLYLAECSKSQMACHVDKRENSLDMRMKKMLDDKKWTDIKFTVGIKPNVKVFEAHRNIISAASPVFEAMCYGGLAENKEYIPIIDVTPDAFKEMLEFIYTDNINLTSVETACATMQAADKYMIDDLTSKCSKFLVASICIDNVHYVLEHACKGSGSADVVRKCMEHVNAVLIRPEFVNASRDTVQLIVDQESLAIPSELVLLEACVRWAEEQCKRQNEVPNFDNLKAVLGSAVGKIRFQTMTAHELVSSDGFKKLLNYEEAFKILANAVKPGTFPVPEEFSISVIKRTKDTIKYCFTNQEKPTVGASQIPTTTAQPSFGYAFSNMSATGRASFFQPQN